jgi:putative oxygen-independent coproporphyrinogen III oxidase
VAGVLPVGDPAPQDGALPAAVLLGAGGRTLSAYVHIPFCRVRCGYCDFNTYTSSELKGVTQASFVDELIREIEFSAEVMSRAHLPARPWSTVFFGGGTPTLLPAHDLVSVLAALRNVNALSDDAEVTVEANPDTVDEAYFRELVAGGVTRVSIGMQSAVPSVLGTLDRTHDPLHIPHVIAAAKAAGLQTSVDLIYGTPGESLDDWRASLRAAIALETDHVSAYALILEDGTALARQVSRGEIPTPDDDLQADMYEMADALLSAAGYHWYEVSNWARTETDRSRHNLAYWTGQDWWGYGPGSHSHMGGLRWWNVKHPSAYAQRTSAHASPAVGRELLTASQREVERILLGSRILEGIPSEDFERELITSLVEEGLVKDEDARGGQVVLTLRGRLLADHVVRRLTGDLS